MREMKRVVVLGANGTMGAGAAGLFAARGFDVVMLARSVDKAQQGLGRAKEAVRAEVLGERIRCGSYEHDLEREVANADLVFEAVSEDLDIKLPYLEQVDRVRRPGTVVGTVSSGLSIATMTEGRSEDFRRYFMGIHLYNPPHVIVGTELIPGPETDREVMSTVALMLRNRLGRVVVECADQPAFAGNRIGFKVLNECAILAEKHGVHFVDYLVGPYTGRAMPPLATIDLVGWDVHQAIVDNVYQNTSDEAHDAFAMPAYMKTLMAQGHLGNKTPAEGGFYRSVTHGTQKTVSVLAPKSRSYSEGSVPPQPAVGFVEQVKDLHRVGRYRDAMAAFISASGPEAEIAQRVVLGYVSYALHRVGPNGVVSAPNGVDAIMGFGFNWAPPSVLVDLFGKTATVRAMTRLGIQVPAVIANLKEGERLFNQPSVNVGRYFIGR